jgi:hypothetical protein
LRSGWQAGRSLGPQALLFTVRQSFQPSGLVYHSFEESFHGAVVERALVQALHMIEHIGFSSRLVHLEAEFLFGPANRQGALGASAEQPDERLVQLVDPLTERVDIL